MDNRWSYKFWLSTTSLNRQSAVDDQITNLTTHDHDIVVIVWCSERSFDWFTYNFATHRIMTNALFICPLCLIAYTLPTKTIHQINRHNQLVGLCFAAYLAFVKYLYCSRVPDVTTNQPTRHKAFSTLQIARWWIYLYCTPELYEGVELTVPASST